MKKKLSHDVYIGILMIIFSVFMYLKTGDMPKGAATFPKLVLTTFAFFGFLIFLGGMKKTKNFNTKEQNINLFQKNPMSVLLIVVIYVSMINLLGFFTSTSLFIIALMLFFRERRIKTIVLTLLGVDLFIYLLFVVQLNVLLPRGLLF